MKRRFSVLKMLAIVSFMVAGSSSRSLAQSGVVDSTSVLDNPIDSDQGVDTSKIYTVPDTEAIFPGGYRMYSDYMKKNLVFPDSFLGNGGTDRTTYVSFVVRLNGEITDIKILKASDDCPECDKEAIRIIESMPLWIPAQVDGVNVHSKSSLPVKFIFPTDW